MKFLSEKKLQFSIPDVFFKVLEILDPYIR